MSKVQHSSPIIQFYDGAKILITGGTGFLGKCLITKFFLSVPNISHIYLIIRPKKGKNSEERLKDTFNDQVFDVLRSKVPNFLEKITCIDGDMTKPRMGLSDKDYDFLKGVVTHIFHSAATVNFNEKLRRAILINVYGAHEMADFCKKCTKIKVFVYVSTTFTYSSDIVLYEEFQEPPMSGDKCLELLSKSEEELDNLTTSIIRPWLNTYSFTKSIAENFIKDALKNQPVLVFRPAIVTGAYKEPLPGWIDNIYGPTGVVAAVATGLMRTLLTDDITKANVVPVDYVVNGLICAAWDVGTNVKNGAVTEANNGNSKAVQKQNYKNLKIFNITSPESNYVTWKEFISISMDVGKYIPTNQAIWYYTLTVTKNKALFSILTVLFHFVPALFMDAFLLLKGKKPRLISSYKKVYTFNLAIADFSLKTWTFDCSNTNDLWRRLSNEDKKIFYFNMHDIHFKDYIHKAVQGIRIFILKEDDSNLNAAKRKQFILWILHRTFQFLFLLFTFWIFNKLLFSSTTSTNKAIEDFAPTLMTNSS